MPDLPPPLRPARPDDAPALADLVVLASEGLSLQAWAGMAGPGESPLDVGRRRAARDRGAFSWRHAVVADEGQGAVAALLGYPLPDTPEAADPDLPTMFVPLQELEGDASGTWYANVLATYPEHQGRGHGSRLLRAAEGLMRATGRRGFSLVVSDRNEGALRFYRHHGFRVAASRPAVDPAHAGGAWLLMIRVA
jgi:ribosomal protein S18 acetylase RimI-like enzyme